MSDALVNKTPVRVKANISKPGACGKPSLLEECHEGITIGWAPPLSDGGSPIINYIIERKDVLSDFWMPVNLTTVTDTQYRIGNLIPGLEYEFRVRAENLTGVGATSPTSDYVKIKYREGFQAPRFIENLQDVMVLEGHGVSFEVVATGIPVPEITWYRNGGELHNGNKLSIDTISGNSKLTISSADQEFEGVIECEAENRAGMAVTSARLMIESSPFIKLASYYEDGLIFDCGDNIILNLKLRGRPVPHLTWIVNDNILDVCSARYHMDINADKLTLTIQDVNKYDSGIYSVMAVNRHGQHMASFSVVINDAPDPPTDLSIEIADDNSYLLRWNAPFNNGGSSVSSYSIFQRTTSSAGTDDNWYCSYKTRNTFVELQNLKVGDHYSFRIASHNIFGVSQTSVLCDVQL